jgi:glycogen synthase
MPQMKVLMTADTVGGVWTYALELVHALRLWSCDVALATMGAPLSPSQARQAAQLPNLTIYESTYQLEWMENPWHDVDAAGEWLLDLAATIQPDVVHLNNYVHGALPWSAPTVVVGHSCVLSWWQAVKGEAAPAEWQSYQQRVQAGLRHADVVAAPTQAMLAALQAHYGPLRTVTVIHNGRTPEIFASSLKENFIFAIGRLWDEAKNIGALDQIAPRLPWPVYVAGDANHPVGGQLHLQQVQSLGYLDDRAIAQWFARASIYALPARYEPFGLSALEAALSGCALILGDIPSLREVWDDAALFVPPDDEDALRESICTLIDRPAQRTHLVRRATQRAARYRPATMGAAYWQLYRHLYSSGDRRRLSSPTAAKHPTQRTGAANPAPAAAQS